MGRLASRMEKLVVLDMQICMLLREMVVLTATRSREIGINWNV
jgi:hypothetical protein